MDLYSRIGRYQSRKFGIDHLEIPSILQPNEFKQCDDESSTIVPDILGETASVAREISSRESSLGELYC